MNEREEWQKWIESAPTIELKITRLRTSLAQIYSSTAHGGPSRDAEKEWIRQQIAELKKPQS